MNSWIRRSISIFKKSNWHKGIQTAGGNRTGHILNLAMLEILPYRRAAGKKIKFGIN